MLLCPDFFTFMSRSRVSFLLQAISMLGTFLPCNDCIFLSLAFTVWGPYLAVWHAMDLRVAQR